MHEGIRLGTSGWVFATSPMRLAAHVRYLSQLRSERGGMADCRNEVFLTSELLDYASNKPGYTWFLPEEYVAIVKTHPTILKGVANYRRQFPIGEGYFKNCELDEQTRSDIVEAWQHLTTSY